MDCDRIRSVSVTRDVIGCSLKRFRIEGSREPVGAHHGEPEWPFKLTRQGEKEVGPPPARVWKHRRVVAYVREERDAKFNFRERGK